MRVYHGSTLRIESPSTAFSRSNLDFGKGFYVTSFKEQAENWALRKAMRSNRSPVVNVYEMNILDDFSVCTFDTDREWLDFVCACRRGESVFLAYDVIFGSVADDRVFDAIDLYYRGIWDADTTLVAIRFYKLSDQYCFVTQNAIDSSLMFIESYEVRHD